MATLFELKAHLENGEKIRRPYWEEGAFIKLIGNTFVGENGLEYPFSPEDALYCYWEVYEEPFKITHTGLYKTRDGRKVFVSFVDKGENPYATCGVIEEGFTIKTWTRSGRFRISEENSEDIVSEWED